jgi:hypothetical protein
MPVDVVVADASPLIVLFKAGLGHLLGEVARSKTL